jgi:structural maintenance of chromosome 4
MSVPSLAVYRDGLARRSDADTVEIGPFDVSFSAIVGPNGSGKSNTIDALLFVFGWRASKMRQGKVRPFSSENVIPLNTAQLSELIHNSEGRMDLDFCSVEIHFREVIDIAPGKFRVAPGSDLIVARTAHRNNSSKYTINRKVSNFTEVTTLLKGKGIDLDHKRFLILQGEVESIAQMKPKVRFVRSLDLCAHVRPGPQRARRWTA